MDAVKIARLTPADAVPYRALMLQAYATEADAFTSTVAEREALALEWWASRIADEPLAAELVFGAFGPTGLVGAAGLSFERRERTAHKALLFGMFVRPGFRGRGIARALVGEVLAAARSRPGTRVVQLTVTEGNAAALRLYQSCGFAAFGIEPLAMKVGDRFLSKVHMGCVIGGAQA
jgi:RimJ/RimL family protein N-acetyltransferase